MKTTNTMMTFRQKLSQAKLKVSKAAMSAAVISLLVSNTLTVPSYAATVKSASGQPGKCAAILKIGASTKDTSKKIFLYPKGVNPATNPEGYMMIGYESEYGFKEAAKLLLDYAPETSVMSNEQWLAKSDRQRIDWIQSRFSESPEQATDAGLIKIVDIDVLPPKLIVDGTGNLEIVMDPKQTLAEWEHAVDLIVGRYGPGSQQAMISKPREAAFGAKAVTAKQQKALVDQHFGWLIYTNLADTFHRMQGGFERYQEDSSKLVLQPFNHPFLGPMTKARRDMMEDYLRQNATGGRYTDQDMFMVTKRDRSFKYSGGPAYRPDIAKFVRWSWETRNAHKDVADLKRKVKRDLNAHASGLEAYESFAKLPAFDSVAEFGRLPSNVQRMLERLFPSKADPRWPYAPEDRVALEVYRNFSYPAQDFAPLLKELALTAKDKTKLTRSVADARTRYLTLLTDLGKDPNINGSHAQANVQGALARFAVDSGLATAFERFAEKLGHEGGAFPEANLRDVLPRAAGQ